MAQQRKIGDSDKSISAVEWLQIKMATSSPQEMVENINVWFKEAKQMDNEQAFEIFKAGQDSMEEGGKNFEQFYLKYYGKEYGSYKVKRTK